MPIKYPEEMPMPVESPEEMPMPVKSPEEMPMPVKSPEEMPMPIKSPEEMPMPIKSPEEMPRSQRAEGATPIKFPIRPRSAGISRPDKPGSGKASREEVGQTWVRYPQAAPGTPGCKGTPEP